MANAPVQKYKAGSVSAAIWKNVGNKNGRETEFHTVSLNRNYKKDDQWQSTNSLRVQDIPDALLVLGKAQEFLRLKDAADEAVVVG